MPKLRSKAHHTDFEDSSSWGRNGINPVWRQCGDSETTTTVFDSFAMVVSSFDPMRDFRDSMVEMIRERGITRCVDLERLLACYLTLNGDEYHHIIFAAFREVWCDMKN
ncbi:hypothetical protein M569_05187 [Genlisea aurea]|uniref:Transcription repressor n=1 Tax=Genlisea aurea TaxID=192259 RepID=S8CQV6_9LAMI|nr:hypothetical protein M569_05187 [Genlisea aurea]